VVLIFEQNTHQGRWVFLFQNRKGGEDLVRGLPVFASERSWCEPDAEGYTKKKGVVLIEQRNDHNGICQVEDGRYDMYRLRALAESSQGRWLSRFPGHTLPGPGAGNNEVFAGSLEWQRYTAMAKLVGVPKTGKSECVVSQIDKIPLCVDWGWPGVVQPEIRVLHPQVSAVVSWDEFEWERHEQALRRELRCAFQINGFSGLFAVVRGAWDAGNAVEYTSDALRYAGELVGQFGVSVTAPIVALELEALASYYQYSAVCGVHSVGIYRDMWIEVGDMSLGRIKATELVVTDRIRQELDTLSSRGFSPIVVNEYGCNTDGSHRHTAVWLWNLLGAVGDFGHGFESRVADFINRNAKVMGPIVVREALRVLSELLDRNDDRRFLENEIVVRASKHNPITHLPVILFNEYSAGTVVKKQYDEGTDIRRVDPTTYRLLAHNSSYTLPARGPYHRTDRSLLPWFQILDQ